MARRNLLRKNDLAAFTAWLTARGRTHLPGRGTYQVLQVRVDAYWHVIYERNEVLEHFSVPEPLVPLVNAFIRESKQCPPSTSSSADATSGPAPSPPIGESLASRSATTTPTPSTATFAETFGGDSSTKAPW